MGMNIDEVLKTLGKTKIYLTQGKGHQKGFHYILYATLCLPHT